MSAIPSAELQDLAKSFGIQLEYRAMDGEILTASTETLLAILQVLGAELKTEADAPKALRDRRLGRLRRGIEPVVVLWEEDGDGSVEFWTPANLKSLDFDCLLKMESGESQGWKVQAEPVAMVEIDRESFATYRLEFPPVLPTGYYRLDVSCPESSFQASTMIIRAPRRAYADPAHERQKPWGIFCPLYALHRSSSWGAGDFSDLEALIDWTAEQGGRLVATLPMLASHFDGDDPIISPYSPTSKLFWNEFYLDLQSIPELAECEPARALLEAESSSQETDQLRTDPLVDYGRQMKLKRAVLQMLSAWYFEREATARVGFEEYVRRNPKIGSYAHYKAARDRHGHDWRDWPAQTTEKSAEYSDHYLYHYHAYVQWKMAEQLERISSKAKREGLTWYLDFPIGVDHSSFDVWHYQEIFATGASVGCPPDPVFTKGQNWGFPPIHPDRQRESGYAYLIDSLRSHLRYANALRIDHVMGLHRLFWIPNGAEAKNGAFVSTPSEEIYAILSVESHRHKAWLVGEDLGTVPPEVERAMTNHQVRGMYVIQYEIRADEQHPLRDVPRSSIASVNTHDMPTFASFWAGLDLDDRFDLGLLDEKRLGSERLIRADQRRALTQFLFREGRLGRAVDNPKAVLQAVHEWLATSSTSVLLLNLEDLWLEILPQNTPNTYTERPNWRKKLRYRFDQFSTDPEILAILRSVDQLRSKSV